jgi:hypothetical protein
MQRAVLYLDLDDTVISWAAGFPAGAPGLREFLIWALETFEVRWLTRWARTGAMEPRLLADLAAMSGVPVERLAAIRGLPWGGTDCKLDGIAWVEHIVLQRPFLWLEDETIGVRATDFLAAHGFAGCWHHCNVTRDPHALRVLHRQLAHTWGDEQDAA